MFALHPLSTVPEPVVESLLDRAFGPDRHGRTAYRLRAGCRAIDALAFAARDADDRVVGTIQCWPIALAADDGGRTAMVMVGPVAVDPALQGVGIGRALMARVQSVAGDDAPLMLIGDPDYYDRFGFTDARTALWRLPGPFERHRLLARGCVRDAAGLLVPDPARTFPDFATTGRSA